MRAFLRRACVVWQDRRGATAIEYGLILAVIVLALIASIKAVGMANLEKWELVASEVIRNGPKN